jgi:4-amino-4-deoxy-L-arabinose transferase-like glycosyltransferase
VRAGPARRFDPLLEQPRTPLLVLGAALLGTCGILGLFEPTETRYAEIAREMLESGDWLVPRLDGIPHFHKPPLAYWAAATGMGLLGVNGWGARLAVALVSLATLGLAGWIAARRFENLAVRGHSVAWILGSMLLFAVLGRALAADPFLMMAVAGFWALSPSAWALAAIGLGFLAKGPVVFVHTVLPVLAAALWARDRRFLALLGPRKGWLVFALLALPWYLAVVITTPGLLEYFLGNQIWGRYATAVHTRAGPPWYFVLVLLAGALPWTAAMMAGLVRTWRERSDPEARLLLCWLVAPLIFFSFSGSKLPAYLLPSLPAAAILAARALESRAARWGAAVTLIALAVAAMALGGSMLARAAGSAATTGPHPWLLAAGTLLALGGLAAAFGRSALAALLAALAIPAAAVAALPYESALGSPRALVQLLADQRERGEPVVEVGHFNAGLPFYLNQRVPLLEVAREQDFIAGADHSVIVPRDSLAAWVSRHGRVWTLGHDPYARQIAEELGLGYSTVAHWRKETLGLFTPKP